LTEQLLALSKQKILEMQDSMEEKFLQYEDQVVDLTDIHFSSFISNLVGELESRIEGISNQKRSPGSTGPVACGLLIPTFCDSISLYLSH
jgi:hypothetical protein